MCCTLTIHYNFYEMEKCELLCSTNISVTFLPILCFFLGLPSIRKDCGKLERSLITYNTRATVDQRLVLQICQLLSNHLSVKIMLWSKAS